MSILTNKILHHKTHLDILKEGTIVRNENINLGIFENNPFKEDALKFVIDLDGFVRVWGRLSIIGEIDFAAPRFAIFGLETYFGRKAFQEINFDTSVYISKLIGVTKRITLQWNHDTSQLDWIERSISVSIANDAFLLFDFTLYPGERLHPISAVG